MILAVTRYVVECDGCQVLLYHGIWDVFFDEVDAAEAAPNLGWRTDGRYYWCPECQALPHEHVEDPEDPAACARCGELIDGDET